MGHAGLTRAAVAGALLQNPSMQPLAQSPAFALAKIQPPRQRTSLVARPALEQALGAALQQHRLTLLVAPAGCGKTAALTRQIRLLPPGCALAWVSADADDQLQRFLACLSTALAPLQLPWRVAPDALGTLAQAAGGLRAVAHELVNALAAAAVPQGLIVVDDAHRIADPQVFALLQALIERLPERWSLAIASRVDPPLTLARWRAGGELAEFRQPDLRFNASEVDALVLSLGLDAATTPARALLQQTEGWAAGLRLGLSAQAMLPAGAAAARPGTTDANRTGVVGTAAQRHLFDYLASEVLDDMPAELRWFLLRCSVLPELTAGRCAHVARLPHTERLLGEVERRGLFVATLDADELTLRLHDLFRDFLESRLQRDFPAELPHLLRRAADHEGDLVRAVGYLARAGAWDGAVRLLAQRGPQLISQGGGAAISQMLALFPADQRAARPDLHLLAGLAAFQNFHFVAVVDAMEQAADGYQAAGRATAALLAQAFACLGRQSTGALAESAACLAQLAAQPLDDTVRSFVHYALAWAAFAQGRGEAVAPQLAAMVDALARVDDPQAWDRCFFISLLAGLPAARPQLQRFADGAMRLTAHSPSQLRASVLHVRAWLAFAEGDLAEADARLALADEDCRWLGHPRSLMTENWLAHTLLDAVAGRRDSAYAAADHNRRTMDGPGLETNRQTHLYDLLSGQQRAAWVLGDTDLVRKLQAPLQQCANPLEWAAADPARALGAAMVAMLDGQLAAARALLQPLAEAGEQGSFFPNSQARLMLADVSWRLGAHDDAASTLAPWCAAARAGGEVAGALLCGAALLQRLAMADWAGRLQAADVALLQRLAAGLPQTPATPLPQAPSNRASSGADHLAALTERERAVLARIAAGDSNKLIARAFDLSPHTVKRHVANILDKLGVQTRVQAASRWGGDRA